MGGRSGRAAPRRRLHRRERRREGEGGAGCAGRDDWGGARPGGVAGIQAYGQIRRDAPRKNVTIAGANAGVVTALRESPALTRRCSLLPRQAANPLGERSARFYNSVMRRCISWSARLLGRGIGASLLCGIAIALCYSGGNQSVCQRSNALQAAWSVAQHASMVQVPCERAHGAEHAC